MGFLSSQGSLDQTSSRNSPANVRTELTVDGIAVDNVVITGERALQDTFLPSTAVNEDLFKNELSLLAGYPEGRILEVTYFYQEHALTNIRSMNVERITADTDWTHLSFTQIRNFELRISTELNFEYDNSTNISSVQGEGLVLAGFEPLVNDLFLYKLRNERIGVFVVNSVQRTALGNDTYHKITFSLTQYLDAVLRDRLAEHSARVVYFDKTKFVVGNHAFLTTDGYGQKKDLAEYRREIINDYVSRFYTTEINSFLRPDRIYDPYVVEYWNRKVGYKDCHIRPTQMLISQHSYNRTIWAVLTGTPVRDITKLDRDANVINKRYATWDTNVNALVDKYVLLVGDDYKFEISGNNLRRFMSSTASGDPYFDHANKSIIHRLETIHKRAYHDSHGHCSYWPRHHCHSHHHHHHCCDICHHDDGQCIHHLIPNPGDIDPGFTYPNDHHHNHCVCCYCDDFDKPIVGKSYALSEKFYQGDRSMSDIERLIYDNIHNKDISVDSVINTIEYYQEWDSNEAFYYHLLAIHLIDYCTYWLVHHS